MAHLQPRSNLDKNVTIFKVSKKSDTHNECPRAQQPARATGVLDQFKMSLSGFCSKSYEAQNGFIDVAHFGDI